MSDLELRIAVATKVMEWRRAVIGGVEQPEYASRGVWVLPEHLPDYESDIAAAWLVVERMRELGYVGRVFDQRDCPGDPRWRADFQLDFEHDDDKYWQGLAPTAPLAICRAALAAIEATQ